MPIESDINQSEENVMFTVSGSMGEGDFGSAVQYVDRMSVKISPKLVVDLSVQHSDFESREIVVGFSECR